VVGTSQKRKIEVGNTGGEWPTQDKLITKLGKKRRQKRKKKKGSVQGVEGVIERVDDREERPPRKTWEKGTSTFGGGVGTNTGGGFSPKLPNHRKDKKTA